MIRRLIYTVLLGYKTRKICEDCTTIKNYVYCGCRECQKQSEED